MTHRKQDSAVLGLVQEAIEAGDDAIWALTKHMLERYNEEIKRRTRVVRIFPNERSCIRLVAALAIETNEVWMV